MLPASTAQTLRARILVALEILIPFHAIALAGHSLGGALATLAAFDIARELKLRDISVVTFGAPRTGNRAFAREYELLVPDTWHMINAKVGSVLLDARGWQVNQTHEITINRCGVQERSGQPRNSANWLHDQALAPPCSWVGTA